MVGTCAGLISLSIQVIQSGYVYAHAATKFKAEVGNITNDVVQLSGLLTAIKSILNQKVPRSSPPIVGLQILTSCEATLSKIKDVLERGTPDPGKRTQRKLSMCIIWPLKKLDLDALHQRLERHKAALDLALSTNALYNVSDLVELIKYTDISSMN